MFASNEDCFELVVLLRKSCSCQPGFESRDVSFELFFLHCRKKIVGGQNLICGFQISISMNQLCEYPSMTTLASVALYDIFLDCLVFFTRVLGMHLDTHMRNLCLLA